MYVQYKSHLCESDRPLVEFLNIFISLTVDKALLE